MPVLPESRALRSVKKTGSYACAVRQPRSGGRVEPTAQAVGRKLLPARAPSRGERSVAPFVALGS